MESTNAKGKVYPVRTLLEGKPYTRHTDVQETWKAFGWKPTKHQQRNKRSATN